MGVVVFGIASGLRACQEPPPLELAGRGSVRRRSAVRLIVMDAHQAEAVRAVRTPIVVRPEPDVSIIVRSLFVIPAERIAPGFRGVRVEEYPREVPPSRFNSRLGRAGALVGITSTSKPASRIALS